MSLSHLSATELARIDDICLRFEAEFKAGKSPQIHSWVGTHSDVDSEVLRAELSAVRSELIADEDRQIMSSPAADSPAADSLARVPGEWVIGPGVQLGPYKIKSLIGRGGMGRVYLGLDTRLQRSVAIKVLADDWAQRPDRIERFERESRAVAAIRHPNIVSLFDIGSHCGRPYAVMELLEGETLRARLQRGPMPAPEVRQMGTQAADALAAAHAHGIVHRDLKPENLVLVSTASGAEQPTGTPIVKLLDFGLSRASESDLEHGPDATASGIVMGTAGYMSPEQARGEKAGFAADIFGLGCVLYECFYGQPPFPGKTVAESLGAVLHAEPLPVASIAVNDAELADVIRRCLCKQPQDRPSSSAEVARLLRSPTSLDSERRDKSPVSPVSVKSKSISSAVETMEIAALPGQATEPAIETTTISRRGLAVWIVGASAGLVGAAAFFGGTWKRRPQIDSIAVLPFEVGQADSGQPVGSRTMSAEEMVAAMLVNQLARQRSLKVVPFRPIRATSGQYSQIGEDLGVEALVLVRLVGDGLQQRIHLQLVDAASSAVLWGKEFKYSDSDSLLDQRTAAARLAEEIGLQVASIQSGGQTKDDQAYSCLVKGEARLDPDSESGLRDAMACFDHARGVDPSFAEAHAGYSLSAMSLAAVSPPDDSKSLVLNARSAMLLAIKLQPDGATSNLAAAMVHWRDDREYDLAEVRFQKTLQAMPNSWHAQHEYALFVAARSRGSEAVAAARRAVTLNPLSQTLLIDEARLRWFDGETNLAQIETTAVLANDPNNKRAIGLAIDLYEQTQDYDAAAALQGMTSVNGQADDYFRQRQAKLTTYPYGPFGPVMNQAILDSRLGHVDDTYIAQLIANRPTTLVFLMSAHPAFVDHRDRPIAQQVVATNSPS